MISLRCLWVSCLVLVFFGCADDSSENIGEPSRGDAQVSLPDAVTADVAVEDRGLADSSLDAHIDAVTPDTSVVMADGSIPIPNCDPPLELSPERTFAAPFDLKTFSATGGTGNYRYTLQSDGSGAILNELTGAYLAGSTQGVEDVILVTDVECAGEALATVAVVSDLAVIPETTEARFGHTFTYETAGGSGSYVFELIRNESGAEITDTGLYRAGSMAGVDLVRVTDPETGLEQDLEVRVLASIELSVEPRRLFMVAGAELPLTLTGGSGTVDAVYDAEVSNYDAETGLVSAVGVGRTTIQLTDRFAGVSASLTVDVAASLTAPMEPVGRGRSDRRLLLLGDIDGDGFEDAALGYSEGTNVRFSDGIVAVYRGTAAGLSDEPTQVFSGRNRDAVFGRDIAAADFNGDGLIDLAVGAPGDDTGGTNSGSVFIYRGVAGGRFEDTPAQTLFGLSNSDGMGLNVETCDFNGDGFVDLIATGIGIENRQRDNGLRDQGGAVLFLGSADGLREAPAALLDGFRLDGEGNLRAASSLRYGIGAATADFNGDGLCDLAMASNIANIQGRRNDGIVAIYLGRPVSDDPDYPDDGGLGPDPVRFIITNEDESRDGYLGRRLAAGDLNGDGRAELIIAQHAADIGSSNAGIVYVFAGGPLEGPIQRYTRTAEADWSWFADNAGDGAGIAIDIGDHNEDGIDDLLVSAWGDEAIGEDVTANTGGVHLFYGLREQWMAEMPDWSAFGIDGGEQFGEAAVFAGDVNNDGTNDFLVTSGRAADLGAHVGRLSFVNGADSAVQPIPLPAGLGGQRLGQTVQFVETNNGGTYGVVGAPGSGVRPYGMQAGKTWIYSPDADGRLALESTGMIDGTPTRGRDDAFGTGLQVGDFDGDGRPEVAVSSTGEELPGGLGENATIDEACANRTNGGATYLYRFPIDAESNAPIAMQYTVRSQALSRIVAMADINGDGRDDMIIGGPLHDGPADSGMLEVYNGRELPADGLMPVMCEPDWSLDGTANGARLAQTAIRLGDLTGDGCEEFAISEPRRRAHGQATAGAVWLFYGWGGEGCPASPTVTVFAAARPGGLFGTDLAHLRGPGNAAGTLVIGAPETRRAQNNQRTGAIWLVDLERVLALPRETPNIETLTIQLVDSENDRIIEGRVNEGRFGYQVASDDEFVFASELFGQHGEATRIGGIFAYDVSNNRPEEVARFVGETFNRDDRFGHSLSIGGTPRRILIGASQGTAGLTETGSVYEFELSGIR
ncbi:MAG: hypothetical protein ACON3Z_15915 [Bradymonadia bacterium]